MSFPIFSVQRYKLVDNTTSDKRVYACRLTRCCAKKYPASYMYTVVDCWLDYLINVIRTECCKDGDSMTWSTTAFTTKFVLTIVCTVPSSGLQSFTVLGLASDRRLVSAELGQHLRLLMRLSVCWVSKISLHETGARSCCCCSAVFRFDFN